MTMHKIFQVKKMCVAVLPSEMNLRRSGSVSDGTSDS